MSCLVLRHVVSFTGGRYYIIGHSAEWEQCNGLRSRYNVGRQRCHMPEDKEIIYKLMLRSRRTGVYFTSSCAAVEKMSESKALGHCYVKCPATRILEAPESGG